MPKKFLLVYVTLTLRSVTLKECSILSNYKKYKLYKNIDKFEHFTISLRICVIQIQLNFHNIPRVTRVGNEIINIEKTIIQIILIQLNFHNIPQNINITQRWSFWFHIGIK